MDIDFNKHKNRLFAISAYLWASLIPAVANVLVNPFLARNLSPYDYSIIGYITSFNLLLLPIVGFSFISYYSRSYFLVDDQQRINIRNTLLSSLATFGSFLAIVFTGFFYLYARYTKLTIPFYPYAIVGFLPTFFSLFFSFYLTDKKMARKPGVFLRLSLINSLVLMIITLIAVVVFKLGAFGRLSAVLVVSIIFGIFGFISLITKFEINKKIFCDAITFCWPLSVSAILYYFLSGIDRLFLERLNDNTQFGYYNIAFQISGYTGLLGMALFQTFDPDIYQATAKKEYLKIVKIVLIIVAPCLVVNLIFIIFSQPIIKILTFGRYIQATFYTQVLCIRNIVTPVCFALSDIIVGLGYSKIELYNRIFGGILSIFLYRYLINYYGFIGAAWGQSFTMILMSLLSLSFFLYRKKLKKV